MSGRATPFRFRRFSMTHARSPMKVGTDGVLLGAWADAAGAGTVLDVGTGCGLVALMMAQRFPLARFEGIDTDAGAVEDAAENFSNSPFADRMRAFRGDFLTFDFPGRYDLVVSNPPFFTEDTLPADTARAGARNALWLPVGDFADKIARVLSPAGRAAVIYPYLQAELVVRSFAGRGLFLTRRTDVKGGPERPLKRSLLAFSRDAGAMDPVTDELCLCDAQGARSARYVELTRDFHP